LVVLFLTFPDCSGFGEWPWANIAFAAAFFVALGGVIGIAIYILRKDAINRAALDDVVHSPEGH
jgi:hypothetical protein